MSNVKTFTAHGLSCAIRRERGSYSFSLILLSERGKPRRFKGLGGFVGIEQAIQAATERAAQLSGDLGLAPSREA